MVVFDWAKKGSVILFLIGLGGYCFKMTDIIHFIGICFVCLLLLWFGLFARLVELEDKLKNKIRIIEEDNEIRLKNLKAEIEGNKLKIGVLKKIVYDTPNLFGTNKNEKAHE